MPRAYNLKNPPSPEIRRARAIKAAAERDSTDNLIKRLVDKAPPLTEEQRAKLSALLRPAGGATE